MAHFAGLVAAGLHPNPVPHADLVSTTVHKSAGRGPGPVWILGKKTFAKPLNSAMFPAPRVGRPCRWWRQGDHVQDRRHAGVRRPSAAHAVGCPHPGRPVARPATSRRRAHPSSPHRRTPGAGGPAALRRWTARPPRIYCMKSTINRNAVPDDPRPPMVTSGVRIGTSALATRGFGDVEFAGGGRISSALRSRRAPPRTRGLRARGDAAGPRVPVVRRAGRLAVAQRYTPWAEF